MPEPTPQTLLRQTRRLVWRSFLAAAVVGSLGGGLVAAVVFSVSALTGPGSMNPFDDVIGSFFLGTFFAPILWMPGWLAITVLVLAWLWFVGELDPRMARYLLALVSSTLSFSVFVTTDSFGSLTVLASVLAAIIAGAGVWVTVPWILRPPDIELRRDH